MAKLQTQGVHQHRLSGLALRYVIEVDQSEIATSYVASVIANMGKRHRLCVGTVLGGNESFRAELIQREVISLLEAWILRPAGPRR